MQIHEVNNILLKIIIAQTRKVFYIFNIKKAVENHRIQHSETSYIEQTPQAKQCIIKKQKLERKLREKIYWEN